MSRAVSRPGFRKCPLSGTDLGLRCSSATLVWVIIGPESALRKIPVALDRKQAFFLEGIRVCVEMIDFAHGRLQQTLLTITEDLAGGKNAQQSSYTSAMLDAWSVIDSVHRLRDLAQHLPNVKHRKQIPGFHYLFKNSDNVNKLRNTVQHLPGSIRDLDVTPQWSVWGVLNWSAPYSGDRVYSCCYMCGKLITGQPGVNMNPLGRKIRLPVGLITLSQDPVAVCISDLMDDVEVFAKTVEGMFAKAFEENPLLMERYASDVLLVLEIQASD